MRADDATGEGFIDNQGNWIDAARHVNPDKSVGGWVAATARVADTAYLGPLVLVCPGVVISSGAVIQGSCVITSASSGA